MIVLQDTREQHPMDFSFYPQIEVKRQKLDLGDYTLAGMENTLVIERKASTSELAMNVGLDRVRFEKELEKTINIKYVYLILEFSMNDVLEFPKGSNIPKSKLKDVRIHGKFILKILNDYEKRYGLTYIFCDNKIQATEKVVEIFERITKMV